MLPQVCHTLSHWHWHCPTVPHYVTPQCHTLSTLGHTEPSLLWWCRLNQAIRCNHRHHHHHYLRHRRHQNHHDGSPHHRQQKGIFIWIQLETQLRTSLRPQCNERKVWGALWDQIVCIACINSGSPRELLIIIWSGSKKRKEAWQFFSFFTASTSFWMPLL